MSKPIQLIPVDLSQCQAEMPNRYTFMTFGGSPGMVRCKNKPVFIATELLPGEDGLIGSMSLCPECLTVMHKQIGLSNIELSVIDNQ